MMVMVGGAMLGVVVVVRSWRMIVVRVGQKPVLLLLLVAVIERRGPVFQFRGQHLSPSAGSAGIVYVLLASVTVCGGGVSSRCGCIPVVSMMVMISSMVPMMVTMATAIVPMRVVVLFGAFADASVG